MPETPDDELKRRCQYIGNHYGDDGFLRISAKDARVHGIADLATGTEHCEWLGAVVLIPARLVHRRLFGPLG